MKQEIRERIEKIHKGEVPEGYQKTKVSIIPEEWDAIEIGKMFEFKNGLNKEKEFFGHGKKIVNFTDVYNNRGIKVRDLKGLVNVNTSELERYKVDKGDVFFTRTSETIHDIGMSSVVLESEEEAVFSGFILRARPKNNMLSLNFKKYCFSTNKARKEIVIKSSYTTRALTSGTLLNKVLIAVPPESEEQEKIAEILSTWDKAIELKEKLIKEKKDFKRGLMQRLLTGGTRFPKFTDEWEEKKINDILKYEQPNKYITNNIVDTDETLTPVLTANKSFVLGSTYDKNGIYTETPVIIFDDFTIDNKYVDFPFKIKSSAIKILKTKNDSVDIKFVYELMKFVKFPFGEHKRYYISEYQFVKIKMPKHIEQLKIVGVSNDLDSELKILNKELNQLKEQKKGLMQLLLTGIVRVEVN